jgi:SPP1 gp7 family putative phage head morphogenesis protein
VKEFVALAKEQPALIAGMANTTLPVAVNFTFPTAAQMANIATAQPFSGKTLREWARNASARDVERITDQVKIGMTLGEDSRQIARRVVGTTSLQGRDGVARTARRNAAAITRTAVTHIANRGMMDFIEANKDVFEKVQFVATLDNRTTAICMATDGKIWKTTDPRIQVPPLHMHCRSILAPAFDRNDIAQRPEKPFTERQLKREFQESGSRDYAAFARRRKRELTGTVPADTTYNTWLKGQSRQFQDEVLGPTKAKLYRDGGLSLDKFVGQNGRELSLRDLAKFHKDAFRAAGLNPEGF